MIPKQKKSVELTSKPAPLVLGEKRKMFRWPRDTEPVVFLEASCSSKKPWNPADQKDQKRRRIPSKPVVFLGAASYEDQPPGGHHLWRCLLRGSAAGGHHLWRCLLRGSAAGGINFQASSSCARREEEDVPVARDTEPVVFLEASCSSKKPWNPADQKDQKRRRIPSKPVVFLGAASYEDQPQVDITFGAASYEDLPQVDITFGAASYEDLPQASCSSKKPWNPADQKDQKEATHSIQARGLSRAASYEDQPQVDITFGAASYEDLPQVDITFGAASYEDLPQDQPQVDITFGAASYEDLPQVDITFGAASYEDLPQVELTSKPAPLVLGEKRKMFRWPRDTEPVVFLEASCSSKKPWNLG
ncbi:unnamed protein product [Pleuronectes platessa]|uniref:Uncharacterized protein n=1 Tax=Pleuronectes platessa TaxID=8262 RepID=A0A9N7VGK6_PLEPL|nr:unnamed protein product [Pleuronectes platessa]